MPFFYAVAAGYATGIFETWTECERQVKGCKGAKFKKFTTRSEAEQFIFLAQSQKSAHALAAKGNDDAGGISASLSKNLVTTNVVDVPQYIAVKKKPMECSDYIPLESFVEKQEIKEDISDASLFFEDTDGDQELLLAASCLQEYPDSIETDTKKAKNSTLAKKPDSTSMLHKHIKIGRFVFTMDNECFIDVYICGAYDNIGKWDCMAGYGVYFGDKHPLNAFEAATGRLTHNVADIEAAIHAIKAALDVGVEKLCLHTDSEFLLKAVTSWLYLWKRKNWRTNAGKVVQNRKEFEKLDALLNDDAIAVKWRYVKGDGGATKPMREAKQLAKLGMDEYLELHPTKDPDMSFDVDCDYY